MIISMIILKFIILIIVVGDDYSFDNGQNLDAYGGYAQGQDSSGHEDGTVSTY